jgi:hypothetical protein
MATVRASVPGTIEARRSVLEAMLPTKRTLKAGAAPGIDVEYAGEPQFEAIPSTTVSRAVNSPNDVIAAGQKYYLVYQGAWYVSDSPNGPWAATGEVPPEVYQIPPSSPSYPVTQVIVQTTDDGDIESSYAAAYATSMFIGFGIGYYGTGWYYPPYYGYGGYYPYYPSYGHGSWYNPNTGGFGSRSVYYGPYGGYTYNQGYNPKTGRYSNVETAWDGNEWASAGETYNPRTGISTETGSALRRRLQPDEDGPHDRRAGRRIHGREEADRLRYRDAHDGAHDQPRRKFRRDSPAPAGGWRHDVRQVRDGGGPYGNDQRRARARPGHNDDRWLGRQQRDDRPRAHARRKRQAGGQLHWAGRADGRHRDDPRRPLQHYEGGRLRRRQRDLGEGRPGRSHDDRPER